MERQQNVGAVILAAGESRRFGGAKQVAQLGGRTLLEHVLALAAEAGLAPIVAVVPGWLSLSSALDKAGLALVRNDQPDLGMSHSLKLGIDSLSLETDAAVILLGDQPTLPTDHIRALVAARGDRPLVATRAEGRMAPPILVERSHYSIMAETHGDIGLREVLDAHPEWVTALDVPAHSRDVDTQADLDRLRSDLENGTD